MEKESEKSFLDPCTATPATFEIDVKMQRQNKIDLDSVHKQPGNTTYINTDREKSFNNLKQWI